MREIRCIISATLKLSVNKHFKAHQVQITDTTDVNQNTYCTHGKGTLWVQNKLSSINSISGWISVTTENNYGHIIITLSLSLQNSFRIRHLQCGPEIIKHQNTQSCNFKWITTIFKYYILYYCYKVLVWVYICICIFKEIQIVFNKDALNWKLQ